jgi:hypothetical protein
MKSDKALKNANLVGLPPLFEPAFFDTTRLKGMYTRALFPCPDYHDMGAVVRDLGFAFSKKSPEYKAYIHYAWRRPGHWDAMLFDAVALAARAVSITAQGVQAAAAPAETAPRPLPAGSPGPMALANALSAPAPASPTAAAAAAPSPTAVDTPAAALADKPVLTRDAVRLALLGIDAYRGIRGVVKFGATREPVEPRAMVYLANNRVNRKEMLWIRKVYGPPF